MGGPGAGRRAEFRTLGGDLAGRTGGHGDRGRGGRQASRGRTGARRAREVRSVLQNEILPVGRGRGEGGEAGGRACGHCARPGEGALGRGSGRAKVGSWQRLRDHRDLGHCPRVGQMAWPPRCCSHSVNLGREGQCPRGCKQVLTGVSSGLTFLMPSGCPGPPQRTLLTSASLLLWEPHQDAVSRGDAEPRICCGRVRPREPVTVHPALRNPRLPGT